MTKCNNSGYKLSPYLMVSTCPVITSPTAMLGEVNILGVVEFCVRRVHDGVDDPRLKIQKN